MAEDKGKSAYSGKILKGVGGTYSILRNDGIIVEAKPRGIFRKDKTIPYPGDNVQFSESGDPKIPFCIDSISPRMNFLSRPALANLDLVLITTSAIDPVPDYFFIEKMVILCAKSEIGAAICVTKADIRPDIAETLRGIYEVAGYKVFVLGETCEYEDTVAALRNFIKGKTITFAGQSGVGKSTIFNRIIGTDHMNVGIVSDRNKRGRHTTRHSEVMAYKEGFIADTPGFSTLEITEAEVTGEEVLQAYPEILKVVDYCRFSSCKHTGDLGCAVDADTIDSGRLGRYIMFRKQADSVNKYDTNKKSGGGQFYGS
ncbi:MAG: ribosome small subunit-dependent GTPase A [Saccharofermentanales bacterium]